MKNTVLYVVAATLMVLVSACDSKKAPTASNQQELDEAVEYLYRDSTIYGICTAGSAMNTLQLATDNGDTLTLTTLAAQEANRLFGGYENGDRMAVIASADSTQALAVINVSTLLGEWVMPNPIDGTSYWGFVIKDGGIVESINQSSVVYKTWRLHNGELHLVSVREGGGDFEEDETYRLVSLTAQSLVIENSEDTYEYERPGREENYDDIVLDDDDDEYLDITF